MPNYDEMNAQRRLGGLPLATYVFALMLIPLTAVGVFSVREVEANNADERGALAVVEAADIDIRVAAVMVPLEIERVATVGLARVDDLGIDRDLVLSATGIDLQLLRDSNAERLDQTLADLAEVIEVPALQRRHRNVVDGIAEVRAAIEQREVAAPEAWTAFQAAFEHADDLLSTADTETAESAAGSVEAAAAVRRLDLVLDVVVSGRGEMVAFSRVVLEASPEDGIELLAGTVRHSDALIAAEEAIPIEIAPLIEAHSLLPRLPNSAFTEEVVVGDSFTLDDILTVTTGLLAHVAYLEQVADFGATESAKVRSEVDSYAAEARDRNQVTLLALVGVGVFTLLFGLIVTQSFVRPLRRLRSQAERISGGELHTDPLAVGGPTDIRKVTGALNEMAGTLSLVEDHMEALATTEVGIDTPRLRELPGHVGASMRTSMDRVRALTTRLQLSESRLGEEARIDHLTGLPNRFAVLEYFDRLLNDEADLEISTGVMFLDVDGFKSVNDTHGHAVGDVVLREIAQRLRTAIRDIDYVARLGGDEFIVVVADAGSAERMVGFGERLISQVEQPYTVGDQLFVVSASVGVTLIEADDDAMSAIERADAAVYQAKRRGRRRVEVFDKELQRSIEHQAELELALRQAIQHNELRVYLQPLADLRTGMPSGAEALVRWERPGVGLVSPGEFIPIAERSGLIFELERWVLNCACLRLVEWKRMGVGAGMRLAVNISGRHLIEGNLVDDLDAVILATGADPNMLEIELTESHLLDDVDRASELLRAIGERGIKIAIDDFGTGYSSMTYLQKLPVHVVKIDRSFIVSATTNDFDSTIIDTVVTIGRALNLEIVAEGIETVEQLDYVRQAGVTHGQGYLLARPVPTAEAEAVLFNGGLFDPADLLGQATGIQTSEI